MRSSVTFCVEAHFRKSRHGTDNTSSSALLHSLQQLLDVLLDVLGREVPRVALDGNTVLADEELLEVPRDVCPLDRLPDQEVRRRHQTFLVVLRSWQSLLQGGEQRVLVLAVDLDLVEHLALELEAVAGPDVLEEVEDLLAATVLLVAELVAGEGEHGELLRELRGEGQHTSYTGRSNKSCFITTHKEATENNGPA